MIDAQLIIPNMRGQLNIKKHDILPILFKGDQLDNKTTNQLLINEFIPKIPANLLTTPRVEIIPGDVNGLLEFMKRHSQTDDEGKLRYLLTSGVAIELITGYRREHYDLDIVTLQKMGGTMQLGVDVVTPEKYWVGMQFDPSFLEKTAYSVQFKDDDQIAHHVFSVHPAILLVQKLSDHYDEPPRIKDIEDAAHLFEYWRDSLSGDASWNFIIQHALNALPEKQRRDTSYRLKLLLSGNTTTFFAPLASEKLEDLVLK